MKCAVCTVQPICKPFTSVHVGFVPYNHGMFWVGRDHTDHLAAGTLPWERTDRMAMDAWRCRMGKKIANVPALMYTAIC